MVPNLRSLSQAGEATEGTSLASWDGGKPTEEGPAVGSQGRPHSLPLGQRGLLEEGLRLGGQSGRGATRAKAQRRDDRAACGVEGRGVRELAWGCCDL